MALLQKNNPKMYSCIKCGLLTHKGRDAICNGCDPEFKRVAVKPTPQKPKKFKSDLPLKPKRPGTQLFDLESCKGKRIKNTEFEYSSLIITFTDKSYIKLYGDNQGWGGYIEVSLTRGEHARRDKLHAFGFKCVDCEHKWLPKKLFSTPSNCPRCRHKNIVTVSSTIERINLDDD